MATQILEAEKPENLGISGNISPGELISEPIVAPEPIIPSPLPEPSPSQPVAPGELIEKRGRGRPKGVKNQPKNPDGSISVVTMPQAEIPVVDYEFMAGVLFDSGTGTLSMMFGPEWKPQSPDERQNVCVVLAEYLRSKGVQDVPPGLMLTIVLLAYSAPRLREPKTAEKIKMTWGWFKSKISRKK